MTARIRKTARLNAPVHSSERPSVLLADDHNIITEGLRRLLEPKCNVIGLVHDGRALIKSARALRPDIVVVDITMPLLNGIDATRQLLTHLPKTHVIFLTMHADRAYVAEAFDAGAAAFVVKHAASDELWQAIDAVLAGGTYVSPLAAGIGPIKDKQKPDQSRDHAPPYRLSARQREVLQLIAEGHTVKQIASALNVAPKTVEFHKYRMMRGLGLQSSAQLVHVALKHGLIA